jgi:hypothetical protein
MQSATQQIVRDNEVSNLSVLEQIRLLSEFETAMQELGYSAQLARLRGVYAEELIYILEDFQSLGIARVGLYSAVDSQIISTLIDADFNKTQTTLARYGVDMKAQIARSVIAGQAIDVDLLLGKTLPQVLSYAKTEINTSVSAFNRAVSTKKAIDTFGADPKFIYIGPDDAVTRDFCSELLSKSPPIYRLSEIDRMSNGQLSPVITYGGGYNCRHQWRPVSDDLAREIEK